MIIVAFTNKTSKTLPKLLCRKYKHVAPVLVDKKSMTLIQFVHRKRVVKIKLTWRDIQILKQHGWIFLYLNAPTTRQINQSAWTCVQMVKNLLGITNINIQTPYALYKYLSQ